MRNRNTFRLGRKARPAGIPGWNPDVSQTLPQAENNPLEKKQDPDKDWLDKAGAAFRDLIQEQERRNKADTMWKQIREKTTPQPAPHENDRLIDEGVRQWLESDRAQRLPRQEPKWPETKEELFGISADNSPDSRVVPLVETGDKGYNGYGITNFANASNASQSETGHTGHVTDETFRLEFGINSADVKTLQRWLNELGYTDALGNPLDVDGDFDPRTLEAVNKFKDAVLPGGNTGENRGVVGPTTWNTICREVSHKQRKEARQAERAATAPTASTPTIEPSPTPTQETQDEINNSESNTDENDTPKLAGQQNLGFLSGVGESGNNPGVISSGKGDSGGKSYGAFQFASKFNVQKDFLDWLQLNDSIIYTQLKSAYDADGGTSGSNFDKAWKEIAETNRDRFYRLQYDFTKYTYYDMNAEKLKDDTGFDFNSRGYALKNVLWSRAVHHGSSVVTIFNRAFSTLDLTTATDEQIIQAIYAESGAVVDDPPSSRSIPMTGAKAEEYGLAGKYMKYFSANSSDVQFGVWKRLNLDELTEALNLLEEYG